ncbi:MAG: GTPase HflX [Saccharofermentanales bacterium]
MVKQSTENIDTRPEKAVLVGLVDTTKTVLENEVEKSVEELALLAQTAGAEVVGSAIQRKKGIDNATFVGKGKLEEIASACNELQADVIIFDDELTGAQIRNIETQTKMKVIDRTLLILDIFAQRAKSKEGKLQVELAQQKYRYSRLVGLGESLSRLAGGIGTRGPGESKLETDRRHIKRRIDLLKAQLAEVGKRRGRLREQRRDSDVVTIAVAGYTNAGKSTLINRLCASDLFVEDMLFATLDSAARKLVLPDGLQVVLIDTVGFIRKLPHHLIDAFKSTLEEVTDADIIMHVVDASDDDLIRHMEIVEELLDQLNASAKPRITVFNKTDLIAQPGNPEDSLVLSGSSVIWKDKAYNIKDGNVVQVSSKTGEGFGTLLEIIRQQVENAKTKIKILLPYKETALLDFIRKNGSVEEIEYLDTGIQAIVRIASSKLAYISEYVVK